MEKKRGNIFLSKATFILFFLGPLDLQISYHGLGTFRRHPVKIYYHGPKIF